MKPLKDPGTGRFYHSPLSYHVGAQTLSHERVHHCLYNASEHLSVNYSLQNKMEEYSSLVLLA